MGVVRLARLLLGTLGISLQRELSFRTDLIVRVLLTLLTAAGTVGTLAAVYARVHTLAGWTYGEAVTVLGMFVMVNGLLQALVASSPTSSGSPARCVAAPSTTSC